MNSEDIQAIETMLDALASDLLRSGVVEPMDGAPSLKEVLAKMKGKHPVTAEGIDAAEKLAYLLDEHWYGETAREEHIQEAKRLAAVLSDKLTPILDAYGES